MRPDLHPETLRDHWLGNQQWRACSLLVLWDLFLEVRSWRGQQEEGWLEARMPFLSSRLCRA